MAAMLQDRVIESLWEEHSSVFILFFWKNDFHPARDHRLAKEH